MASGQTPPGAWKITVLLFLFLLVNFADRIVVGLGVPVMTEFELTPKQFGFPGSAFFFLFSFSTSAVIFGFINRIATRWVLLGLALAWSLAQFPMLGNAGFFAFVVCPHHSRCRRESGILGCRARAL